MKFDHSFFKIVAMRLIPDELITKLSSGVPTIEAKLVRLAMEQSGQALPKTIEEAMNWI